MHHLWDLHYSTPFTGSLNKCMRSVEQRKIPARLEPASASNCREILSCRGISTTEKELQSDHSTADWFEIIIPLHHSKYFTENWFPHPRQPERVCWKSLGFHLTSTKDQTFPTCLSEEDVHGRCISSWNCAWCSSPTETTDGLHDWPAVLFSPRLQQEKAFSPNGRVESCTVQAKGEV